MLTVPGVALSILIPEVSSALEIDFDDLSGGTENLSPILELEETTEVVVREKGKLRLDDFVLPVPIDEKRYALIGLDDVTGEQFYNWLLNIYPSQSVKKHYYPAYFEASGDKKVASARRKQVIHAISDYFKRSLEYQLAHLKEPVDYNKIVN